ncbi:MAG: hypothetical protein QG638_1318, partial [Pseudomonadota bacterium]|nr:hypothetical protein [Pseudomonadota bacterium]
MSHAQNHGAAEEFSEHGHTRPLSGFGLKAVVTVALCFSTYQLFVAAFHPFSSLVTRSLHVGFLLLLTFLIYPATKKGARHGGIAWWEWALAATAFALSLYQWVFEGDLIQRAGDPTSLDIVVGCIVVLMLFEAARRILGLALPIVCLTFLAYGLFGQYLPGDLA